MKKIIAFVLAMALCLASVSAFAATDEQRALPAATVGDVEISCGDVQDYYDYLIQMYSYYGMATPTADEDIDSIVESLLMSYIEDNVKVVKAKEMGVNTVTEEQEAAVQTSLEEERAELIESYESQIKVADGATDEEKEAAAIAAINEALTSYYGTEMNFDQYLEQRAESMRSEYYVANLEAAVKAGASVTDEDVKATYDKYLESDKAACEDPTYYASTQNSNEAYGTRSLLYVPEGNVRIKVLTVNAEGTLDDQYTANATQMDALEEEYGTLALTGADEAREAEIKTEYDALKAANDEMFNAYMGSAFETINAAKAELDAGADFTEVMNKYNPDNEYASNEVYNEKGTLIYVAGDADDGWDNAIRTAAANLQDGTYSDVIAQDGSVSIVYRVSEEPAGEKSFESVQDAMAALSLEERAETLWEETMETWENDPELVVRYPDNYHYIGREE